MQVISFLLEKEKQLPMKKYDFLETKITSYEDLDKNLAYWRFKNQRIVFTNGCFDLLHLGHLDYLVKAADLGDVLIVGLNSDDSVKRLKKVNRPLLDQNARAHLLAGFFFVTKVVIFKEDTPYNLIERIKPDVLVKGKDYKKEEIVGFNIVEKNGGEVITLDLVQGYSTSILIEKMKRK